MDYKLELVLIPVADVDRAKKFYLENMGFVLIVDTPIAHCEPGGTTWTTRLPSPIGVSTIRTKPMFSR